MKDVLQELAVLSNKNEEEKMEKDEIVQDEYNGLERLKNSQSLANCTITGFKKSASDIMYFMVTVEGFKKYTGIVKVDDVIRVELGDIIKDIDNEQLHEYIGRKIICRVHEVFFDTLTVILSRDFEDVVRKMKEEIDFLDVEPINDSRISKYDMKKLLEVIEFPVVNARIIGYVKEVGGVMVDIYGLGIRGRISLPLWDWNYVNQDDVMKELDSPECPEYIKVAVVGYTNSSEYEGKIRHFICSKIINPRDDIFYRIGKRFTLDSMIAVECVKRDEKYFWGRNDLFEGDILCYYDDSEGNVNEDKVVVGGKYLVRVKKVSEIHRKFTCSFAKRIDETPKKNIMEI